MNLAVRNKIPVEVLFFDKDRKRFQKIQESLSDSVDFYPRLSFLNEFDLAASRLSTGGVDIVLFGLDSPEESHLQKMGKLRENFQSLPFIVVGPARQERVLNEYLKVGVQDYLIQEQLTTFQVGKSFRAALEYSRGIQLFQMFSRLKNTEESFWRVLNQSLDGIVVVDSENRLKFINPAAGRILNTKTESDMGQVLPYQLAFADKIQIAIAQPDHDPQHFQIQVVEIDWNSEQSFLATFRNITDRVDLEKRKDDFLNTVSHDLRTPLTVIREGVSQVIDGLHGNINEAQKKFLSLSLTSIDRLTRMINDLLDISKIEANKISLKINYEKLEDLINEAAGPFELAAKNKGLKMKLNLPASDVFAFVDRDALIQVLSNLIGNSLKFTETGEIIVKLEEASNLINLSVSDTGRGIPEKDLPRIFDRFEQSANQSSHGPKGTGLGLSISKALIELHGGSIQVESQLDQGTCFHIRLPKKSLEDLLPELLTDIETSWLLVFVPVKAFRENSTSIFESSQEMEKRFVAMMRDQEDRCLRTPEGICLILRNMDKTNFEELNQKFKGLLIHPELCRQEIYSNNVKRIDLRGGDI